MTEVTLNQIQVGSRIKVYGADKPVFARVESIITEKHVYPKVVCTVYDKVVCTVYDKVGVYMRNDTYQKEILVGSILEVVRR